jgi:hypothetical protein
MSNIFGIYPCIFVAKPLAEALVQAKCSGFTLHEAEFEPSDAFLEFHGRDKKLPPFLWCEVHGQPGVDDFGLEQKKELIVSNRVKEIVETGPFEEVIFVPGAKAPPAEEIMRIRFEQAELAAKRI